MILLCYIFLAVLLLVGVHYNRDGWYDPFDRKTTSAIKGFFIAVVFVRHIFGYVQAGGWSCCGLPDRLFILLNLCIGQSLVVMFLFYSGYGVMKALRTKGCDYVRAMPRRRLLMTLLNFDVAVCVFAMLNLLMGIKFEMAKFLLSLVGWESIGNSNWYIFDILVCYALFWLVFFCSRINERALKYGAIFLRLIVAGAAAALFFAKPEWWSSTIMAFPFGSLWAVHQERINNFVKSHYKASLFPLLFFVLLLEALSLRITLGIGYNFFAVIFAATVVVVSMKIRVGNAVLVWCGMNLFPLYIYQRVPMRAFSEYFTGMMDGIGMWAYIVICMLITCAIAYVYRWVEIKIE